MVDGIGGAARKDVVTGVCSPPMATIVEEASGPISSRPFDDDADLSFECV